MPSEIKKAVVTGASGFCGTRMVAHLAAVGIEVRALERRHFYSANRGAFPSPSAVVDALGGFAPDAVFHFAGVAHSSNPALFYESNVATALALLEALRTIKADPVVVIVGSAAEYGPAAGAFSPVAEDYAPDPLSDYGRSKYLQTMLALAFSPSMRVIVTRPFNLVGARMPAALALGNYLAQLSLAIREKRYVLHVRDLSSIRDFVWIEEAVPAWLALAKNERALGRVVNICTGVPMRVGALLDLLIAASPVALEVVTDGDQTQPTGPQVFYGDPGLFRSLTDLNLKSLDLEVMSGIVREHLTAR